MTWLLQYLGQKEHTSTARRITKHFIFALFILGKDQLELQKLRIKGALGYKVEHHAQHIIHIA